MDTEDVLDHALRLPRESRKLVAEELLASLEQDAKSAAVDPDVESAWLRVAERRLEEIRSGQVETIPSEQVHAEIRASLAQQREAHEAP